MLVEQIMNRNAVTVTPTTPIKEVFEIVKHTRVHHIPITTNGKLIGLITARHLRQHCTLAATEGNDLNQRTVGSIMKTNIITAHPLDFVEDVALVMYQMHIGCLPVVQQGQFVGLVTERDIMRTLIEMTGISHPSSQIEVEVENQVENLAKIVQIFKDHQLNISSAFIYPSTVPNKKMLVFRVETIDPRIVVSKIKEAGYHVIWPSLPEE
ncbi:acetoin utilization AcuB family protein [Tepidibacillus fermentans]|uniref:Acetoin utilization protein AcuB n=1 Tax=Tepidibacillus fermentans TaxID=1281767 RepID=A0A4R3KK49_9BACI|nr:acetoin utilization AcuB family protein [Tepidibacillus fermentans]TCS83755.1 acetoin utilization protein AcuB [Tepidibacillus fermentans]